jgi:hypothetical protein
MSHLIFCILIVYKDSDFTVMQGNFMCCVGMFTALISVFWGVGVGAIMFVIVRNYALSKHKTFFIFLLIQHGPCHLKFVHCSLCCSSK